jgi:Domain of unknown function (DUF4421)
MKAKMISVFMAILIHTVSGFSQQGIDSNYSQHFKKNNDVELYTGMYNTVFEFRKKYSGSIFDNRKLMANTSAYIGLHADYKWLSADISTSLPKTFVDNQLHGRKTIGLHLSKTTDFFKIEGGFEKYDGLILPISRRHRLFDELKSVSYINIGLQATFIMNHRHFSLPAAVNYGSIQTRSAGTVVLCFNPVYHQFTVQHKRPANNSAADSALMTAIGRQSAWINHQINLGYSYNFVWDKGHWSINPWLMIGAGVQQKLSGAGDDPLQPIYNLRGIISAGYNGNNCYLYLNGYYNTIKNHLASAKVMVRNNDVSITAGYRFYNLPHKLMSLL